MEKKLSVLNLAEELAEKSSLTASQAEGFVRGFFDVLADGLAQDDMVKVKGWGTFKLSAVMGRESVDVNTGERIVIKGYRKVTFLPETALKERINKPFAQFETTELNDGYSTEEETASVEEAGRDAGALPHADEVNETFPAAAEEATTEPETEITIEPEPVPAPEDVSVREETGTPEPEALKREPDNVKRTRRPRRSWHYWLPIVLLLLVSVCLYIYITFGKGFEKPTYAHAAGEKENSIKVEHVDFSDNKPTIVIKTESPKPTPAACSATASIVHDSTQITSEEGKTLEVKTTQAVPEEAKTLEVKPAPAEPAEAKSAEAKPAQQKTTVQPARSGEKSLKDISMADTTGYVILGTKATHTVQEGETIVQLARKYYNDKRLWPYIVKHNGLKNPNSVQVGKSIAIPELKAK